MDEFIFNTDWDGLYYNYESEKYNNNYIQNQINKESEIENLIKKDLLNNINYIEEIKYYELLLDIIFLKDEAIYDITKNYETDNDETDNDEYEDLSNIFYYTMEWVNYNEIYKKEKNKKYKYDFQLKEKYITYKKLYYLYIDIIKPIERILKIKNILKNY